MFTRTVKSNACSFNNIHPFNYLNATESDLWSLFSRRWGCLLFASFSSLMTSVGFQVLEYKKYLLNGSCNYRGQVYLVLTIAWICYYFQISISIFEHILRCFFLFLSPFLFSLLNYFCNLLVIDKVRLYAFLFWFMLPFQT